MFEVTKDHEKYFKIYEDYPVFQNFVRFIKKYHTPTIYVDNLEQPNYSLMHFHPIFFIAGDYTKADMTDMEQLLGTNAWIAADSDHWKDVLENHYQDNIETYPRVLFDSSSLKLDHILTFRNESLPDDLRIEPIQKEYLERGMIHDDVLIRFFTKNDFMEDGFGFALLDSKNNVHGFALTNYPITSKTVELYFRVGYNDYPKYRNQGIGTTLCTYFIEECLKRGLDPEWDAAHPGSAKIARRFGYVDKLNWFMYHVK